ncbi:MAG: hypothetical protein KC421_28730 [Anaerolineales bacterium]|nr:hypothetical protein [Anaerolineales bacterium]
MKALKQIVIILAVALVVTGITYALGQSQTAQNALGFGGFSEFGERTEGFEGRRPPEGGDFDGFPEGFPQGRGDFGERGPRGRTSGLFNAGSWLTFARTLIPMSIIIVAVVLLSKGIRFARKRVRQS